MFRPIFSERDHDSARSHHLLALIVAIGLALSSGSTTGRVSESVSNSPSATELTLLRTDGDELPSPPPAFTPVEQLRLFTEGQRACQGPCVTPFGTVLGVADGAEGRSNCVSTCIRPERSFLDLQTGEAAVHQEQPDAVRFQYIGVTYQCVEYARKWWMKNRHLTFGDVDSAYNILYLTEGSDIRTHETIPLARSVNGTARRPPQRGDLLIYAADRSDPEWRHGHVAVVVAVDLERGQVALAEENYDNRPWQQPQGFARQIQLFEVGGRYTLLDVPMTTHRNEEGGRITGWIYPQIAP
ncbi:MAG: CHAP domain-containing protein [Candidatus Competibacteraceae bacterium]